MATETLTRRQFMVRGATTAVVASAAGSMLLSSAGSAVARKAAAPQTITLDTTQATYAALANVNGSAKVAVSGQKRPVIVVRTSATDAVAFSSKCTHFGCEVDLPDASGVVGCPCHGSKFSATGKVTGGPAHSDLKQFKATVSGAVITVTV